VHFSTRAQLVRLDTETEGTTLLLTDPLGYMDCLQDHEEHGPGALKRVMNVWERR